MYCFLDYISRKTSKDVVRKLLFRNLKYAFEEVDAQFDELCQCLYSDIIDEKQSKCVFEEILDTLLHIGENLLEYTNQQMEVIGVDKDCDIKFIKEKLANYQLTTNELKGGISDGRSRTIRFTPDNARRNLIVPKYEKFLSFTNEIEGVLQILYESYQKLYDVVYSDESELVLNRFNKQFKNVAGQSTKVSERALEILLESCTDYSLNQITAKKKNHNSSMYLFDKKSIGLREVVFDVLDKTIGDEFYTVYDNPLELARTIQKKQLDNMQVNAFMAMIAMLGKSKVGNNYSPRSRGRPSKDFCYIDYVEWLTEIIETCPVNPSRKLKRVAGKQFFNWIVALFVTWGEYLRVDLYGYASAFYRLFEQIGCKIPYGLRYFQRRINDFSTFLKDKLKGGFYDAFDEGITKSWARKLKIFAPLEKLKNIITEKFIQLQFA